MGTLLKSPDSPVTNTTSIKQTALVITGRLAYHFDSRIEWFKVHIMESLTANQAKTHFGSLLLKAQVEPVQINKNGKPVAVIMSNEQYDAMDAAIIGSIRATAEKITSMSERELGELQDADDFFDKLMTGLYD